MLLFVYGSLKEGFPNHHVNRGRRVPGVFRTVQPYPLYLADGVLPCLLARPGAGLRVQGQLFEVAEDDLAAMDALERVGEPGGYARITIEVEPAGDGATEGALEARGEREGSEQRDPHGRRAPAARTDGATGQARPTAAFVYVQSEARLGADGAHVGPIAEYTPEHARQLRW